MMDGEWLNSALDVLHGSGEIVSGVSVERM